ncbi:MAG: dephospho-CoA kinase [Actinomycetota bacterium]|nr:dephospho-CoA kinase [Actinomycetota bacterium]
MITIGLTGGIGSGKSTVGAMLVQRGAVLVDADQLAREAVEPGTEGYERVVARFGPSVVQPGGVLDRAAIAAVVFNDEAALSDLNEIVHPAVGRLMLERVAEHAASDAVVVLDVPLLVETGGRERYGVSGVLVVDAPAALAVERLVRERAISLEDAERRIAAQATREERLRQADFVIVNTGTLEELAEMTRRAWEWVQTLSPGRH